jgi:hypothetical protein
MLKTAVSIGTEKWGGSMLWLYVSALAVILGAELNAELLKSSGRVLPAKEKRGELLNMAELGRRRGSAG